MNTPAILRTTAKVRPGHEDAFSGWQARHHEAIAKFPGFLSLDTMPPDATGSGEWTIVLNFQTPGQLWIWQKSPERAALVAEILPLLEGGNLGEVTPVGSVEDRPETNVTEVILSKIKPGMEGRYREWSVRIQSAQAKYPGYRGMYLQPPTTAEGRWTTLVRYDTAAHLEAWMAAPERAALLAESKAFIEHEELTRLATAFPGWVPIDPVTSKGPPDWKTTLLVLLGLFPIVMVELKYLSPFLASLHIHASMGTFIGNTVSVFLISYLTMPPFVRLFGWWLFPKNDTSSLSFKGLAILFVLFAIEVALFWNLLPW